LNLPFGSRAAWQQPHIADASQAKMPGKRSGLAVLGGLDRVISPMDLALTCGIRARSASFFSRTRGQPAKSAAEVSFLDLPQLVPFFTMFFLFL